MKQHVFPFTQEPLQDCGSSVFVGSYLVRVKSMLLWSNSCLLFGSINHTINHKYRNANHDTQNQTNYRFTVAVLLQGSIHTDRRIVNLLSSCQSFFKTANSTLMFQNECNLEVNMTLPVRSTSVKGQLNIRKTLLAICTFCSPKKLYKLDLQH